VGWIVSLVIVMIGGWIFLGFCCYRFLFPLLLCLLVGVCVRVHCLSSLVGCGVNLLLRVGPRRVV
jgi:hypothetical protein